MIVDVLNLHDEQITDLWMSEESWGSYARMIGPHKAIQWRDAKIFSTRPRKSTRRIRRSTLVILVRHWPMMEDTHERLRSIHSA